MKNQDFRNWLEWGIPCTILVGIFGNYPLTGVLLYDSDGLPF